MNIRSALKTVLFPACLETTAKMRDKFTERALNDASAVVDRARYALKLFQKAAWANDQATVVIEAVVAIVHGREGIRQLKASIWASEDFKPSYDPLTVIKNKSLESLFIVEHGAKARLLEKNGLLTNYHQDSYAIASDEEVEKCIDELTEDQIRFIFSNRDVFAPILAALLAPPSVAEAQADAGDKNNPNAM